MNLADFLLVQKTFDRSDSFFLNCDQLKKKDKKQKMLKLRSPISPIGAPIGAPLEPH